MLTLRARFLLRSPLAPLLVALAAGLSSSSALASTVVSDSLYNAHHPRLLFSNGDLPALRDKLLDGGPDDTAYSTIRLNVANVYAAYPAIGVTGIWYGMETVPELGIVACVEQPMDSTAVAVGRWLTNHVASAFQVNYDEAGAGMRLRALALGYDLFFAAAPDSERCVIRDEMASYMSLMTSSLAYEVFEYPPYLANHSAMFGAALGLAAITLWDEADPALTAASLAMADRICAGLLTRMFDENGSYYEGGFYALWTLKQLVYYFAARKRFDGVDYAAESRVRKIEEWLAYELLPEGTGHSMNLNDSMYHTRPFSMVSTYLDWATDAWNSGLSAWLWDRVAGPYGWDAGEDADRAGTVLWHRSVPPVHPSSVLPNRRLFPGRGLYHFRTGWQSGASSQDVVFAFYSGKFEGGHAQEDQNQFVLHGYGERFVVDHGSGNVAAKQSEAHNMVFAAGAGQHNTGGSIGTDGHMVSYLLTPFADYLKGDATAAYGKYSAYNNADQPFRGLDWSWGYSGANPVDYAHRHVLAVDDGTLPPYFVVMDDIQKDGAPNAYTWRLHTSDANSVDTGDNPVVVTGPSGASMDMWLMRPDRASVTISTSPFDNATPEPDATLIRISRTAIDPAFVVLMMPRAAGAAAPAVVTTAQSWGVAATIDWGGGVVDYFLRNDSHAPVTHGPLVTDARVAVIRTGTAGEQWAVTEMTTLTIGGMLWAEMNDGPAGCSLVGQTYYLDRHNADFRLLDAGAALLIYRDQVLGFVPDGSGFIVPDGVTGITDPRTPASPLSLSAHPNPFNPTTTVRVVAPAGANLSLDVYDVAGRRVRRLFSGRIRSGERLITWDGSNDSGLQVASGTYFAVAQTTAARYVTKLTLVK